MRWIMTVGWQREARRSRFRCFTIGALSFILNIIFHHSSWSILPGYSCMMLTRQDLGLHHSFRWGLTVHVLDYLKSREIKPSTSRLLQRIPTEFLSLEWSLKLLMSWCTSWSRVMLADEWAPTDGGAGEGLFLRRGVQAGELICYYNGIKVPHWYCFVKTFSFKLG